MSGFVYMHGKTMRSGTINTPRDPRVTERSSVPRTFVAADPLTTVTSHDMNGFKVAGRDTFAIERANTAPSAPVDFIERDSAGTWIIERGDATLRCRTLDDGDMPLALYMAPVAVPTVKAERTVRSPRTERTERTEDSAERDARRAERDAQDRQIMAYLRSIGYTGSLTGDIRSLALDALAFAATVEAYAAG